MSNFVFQKADKAKKKLRLALIGVAGSGKTFSALSIAKGLGGRIALIDTERGSASLYADIVDFDTLDLTSHSPENYIAAIKAAEKAGYDTVVIDSLSHSWTGVDGALEKVDKIAARSQTSNNFTAWRSVTPIVTQLIDTIMGSSCHILATMRAKSEYIIEDVNGKKVPKKIGLAPVIRDGIEYEFDVVGDIDASHTYHITKTRYSPLTDQSIAKPGIEFGKEIVDWLMSGAPVAQTVVAPPIMPAAQAPRTVAPKNPELASEASLAVLWSDAQAKGHTKETAMAVLANYGWNSLKQIQQVKLFDVRQDLGI